MAHASTTVQNGLYDGVSIRNPIKKIRRADLDLVCTRARISNFSTVASYSWSTQSTTNRPIMVVPGTPSLLVEQIPLVKLERGAYDDTVDEDENRFYQPNRPLEPLFRSILVCNPTFNFKEIDVVTDVIHLQRLLKFADSTEDMTPFRVDFQLVGRFIVLMHGGEESFDEDTWDNYNRAFVDICTEQRYDSMGVHNRIVQSNIGPYRVLTRFVNRCVEKDLENNVCLSEQDLLNLADPTEAVPFSRESNLHYFNCGHLKNEKLVELRAKNTLSDEYPAVSKWSHMLFTNTQQFLIGWHRSGQLQRIEKNTFEQVTEKKHRVRIDHLLSKLYIMLDHFKTLALDKADSKTRYAAIYRVTDNQCSIIEVFKTDECEPVLPDGILN